jgi:hypothetical protein
MARTLSGRGATWGPRLLGVFGLGLMGAGLFAADPANGYPAGISGGELTWHGIAHGFAALGAGLALTAAMVVFVVRHVALKQIGWAVGTALTVMVYFVLAWAVAELASLLLVVASVLGWGWVSLVAWRLAMRPAMAEQLSGLQVQAAW